MALFFFLCATRVPHASKRDISPICRVSVLVRVQLSIAPRDLRAIYAAHEKTLPPAQLAATAAFVKMRMIGIEPTRA